MKTHAAPKSWRGVLLAVLLIPLGLATGCAYQRAAEVTAQMAKTESSLQQAEQSGAAESALRELQSARDKYADAQRELAKETKQADQTAFRLAQQAEIDAQYASAKTQTMKQETATRQVAEGTSAVEREAQRDNPPASTR